MNITIRINTDSTAFEGREILELEAIFKRIRISALGRGFESHQLHDSNGQVCGSVEVQESEAGE